MNGLYRLGLAVRGAVAVMTLAAFTGAASGQEASPARGVAKDTYIAVVTTDKVLIRSGPEDTYYPFGRLKADSLVRVVDERDRWARVQTVGPAFKELFGYLRYHVEETGRMQDNGDKTATTLGRIDVLAPNLNTDSKPQNSWKQIARLEADTRVTVLDVTTTEREIIYKIALPPQAIGWIGLRHLRRATSSEQAQWEAAIADDPIASMTAARTGERTPTTPPVLARDEPTTPPVQRPATTGTAGDPAAARPETTGEPQQRTPTPAERLRTGTTTTPAETTTPDAADRAAPRVVAPPVTPSAPDTRDWDGELKDLEAKFTQLKAEPIETAEVLPLQQLFADFAQDAEDKGKTSEARFAKARAEQLQIWSELQERRRELKRLRSRADIAVEDASAARESMERSSNYVAVGRLAASSIYDGKRLPRLLRLQDPATGRTIAYMEPTEASDLDALVGKMVGIVGTKQYDGGLRLNVIVPEHVEALTPPPPPDTE
ncbi:MAG: SH3 domain-containing protein [Planctomycetota bacterium]|jgi:uncharacterized protein YgiM (DUF1202 family)